MSGNQLMLAGAPATAVNYIEDVFSSYIYTGNGGTQTITNGIDLSTKDGLVWIKERLNAASHALFTSAQGLSNVLTSNSTLGTVNTDAMTSYNTTGFTVKYPNTNDYYVNRNTQLYASWTFRKQPKFFDIVTFTTSSSTNTNQRISHNLGSTPGCIIVKSTNNVSGWPVWHRSLPTATSTYFLLNTSDPESTYSNCWGTSGPTSTDFGVNTNFFGTSSNCVAYIFAHNAGGFGLTGSDNVITCGSFNASSGAQDITLGYEPQLVFLRESTNGGKWEMIDTMRGFVANGDDVRLAGNSNIAENTLNIVGPTATGFKYFANLGGTVVYVAIRRGPMKTPTSGTSVFAPLYNTQSAGTQNTTNFPVDSMFIRSPGGGENNHFVSRLQGVSSTTTDSGQYMYTQSNAAEASGGITRYWSNIGFQTTTGYGGYAAIYLPFQRAPGFHDVVCYTGNGSSNRAITHNLGVTPELIIVKDRTNANLGMVYTASDGAGKFLRLFAGATGDYAATTNSAPWNDTAPTSTQFTVDGSGGYIYVNASGDNYVAYLFATCPGVSKVGSYTGTGALLTVNCGFTGGARLIIIKRTDSAGDWYMYNSANGISSGNDPYILLNSTTAQVTGTNYVDTTSVGFQVTAAAPAGLNASGGTYIFLAIA